MLHFSACILSSLPDNMIRFYLTHCPIISLNNLKLCYTAWAKHLLWIKNSFIIFMYPRIMLFNILCIVIIFFNFCASRFNVFFISFPFEYDISCLVCE